MTKGEPILIERAANGFIVNPKEITNFTKNEQDLYVFETLDGLKGFLDKHFVVEKKEEGK